MHDDDDIYGDNGNNMFYGVAELKVIMENWKPIYMLNPLDAHYRSMRIRILKINYPTESTL